MSLAALVYVKDLQSMPRGKKLTKAQKLVLYVLADYHHQERGDAWASLRRIAAESMHTVSGVVRVLRALEDSGVLRIVRAPNPGITRVVNRYQFTGLDTHQCTGWPQDTGDHFLYAEPLQDTPEKEKITQARACVLPVDKKTHIPVEKGGGLLTTGHHIPLKTSLKRIAEQERSGVAVDSVDNYAVEELFKEFERRETHRGGKRLERAATRALFLRLSTEYQEIDASGLRAQGLHAKPRRLFVLEDAGREPWCDWITPFGITMPGRPPPLPPKTDPIARGHWRS